MNLVSRLDLQQRFRWLIFISIVLASCFLVGLMYELMSKYSGDYTSRYWRDHTKTFGDSAVYPVIIGSISQAEAITKNFAAGNNVMKASIFNSQLELVATSGGDLECDGVQVDFQTPSWSETADFWCFYSPIVQDTHVGHVELVISKAEYQGVLRNLLSGSALVVVFFSACIFLVVQRLSKLFTSTLLELAMVLKKVSQGERGVRVRFSGSTEIDTMRTTFNDMLANVELTEHALEQRVDERTSALKIALESSETANVYKAQIMATVSHEMKSPLHAISGYLQLLAERLPPDSTYNMNRAIHAKALVRVNDLNCLIDNILLHASLEADRYEISFSQVALPHLMNVCAEIAAPLLDRNQNSIYVEGPDVLFFSDSAVLQHIVNNLLSNACKFTSNGDIVLTWRVGLAFLVIEVADTGCGIPVESYDSIFDAWWQVDMSLSRKYGGHGLGLAITKQFVQRLGGDIAVAPNITKGKGTVFTVRIPNSQPNG